MLEVESLTIQYPTRSSPAVRDVSLRIDPGEVALLAGASASGKSTLMQAVCGFIPHIIPARMSGRIGIDGEDSTDPARTSVLISMVQQDPEAQFCTETVEEEVAFGPENFRFPRAQIEARITAALAAVNAQHLRSRALLSLSGGEKQKVALAAMLALRPELLIMDEPTANLDPHSIAEVLDALSTLRTRRPDLAIVIVEHRIHSFVDLATRVLLMRDGELVEDADRKRDPARFERCVTILTRPVPYPQPKPPPVSAPVVVQVRDLSCTKGGNRILDRVSLTVRRGETVAVMGRNGAGKTTLLRHLVGLEPITPPAQVDLAGQLLTAARQPPAWELGRRAGFVFQNPNHQLFEHTVEKECLFGPTNFGTDLAAARVGAKRFARTEGVPLSLHPHALSFGQKRRLNIVAGAAHQPQIILLDEPFAGQDAKNAVAIARTLARARDQQRLTLLIVTHDPAFARRFCTRCVVLDDGRVVGDGAPDTVLDRVGGLITGTPLDTRRKRKQQRQQQQKRQRTQRAVP